MNRSYFVELDEPEHLIVVRALKLYATELRRTPRLTRRRERAAELRRQLLRLEPMERPELELDTPGDGS